jgi:hypothetical protein
MEPLDSLVALDHKDPQEPLDSLVALDHKDPQVPLDLVPLVLRVPPEPRD